MVKVIKAFEFLHPIDKKIPGVDTPDEWDSIMLQIKGKASLICTEPHPLHVGWYRLQLTDGKMTIDITFSSIMNIGLDKDMLPEFQQIPELMEALTEKAQRYMRAKFLNC